VQFMPFSGIGKPMFPGISSVANALTAHASSQIAHNKLCSLVPAMAHRRYIALMREVFKPIRLIFAHYALMLALELDIQAMVAIARRRQENVGHARLHALPLEPRRLNLVSLSSVWHVVHPQQFRVCPRLPLRPRKQLFLLCAFQRFAVQLNRSRFPSHPPLCPSCATAP